MDAPTFPYPGGKAHIRDWLISLFPSRGQRYVEWFAGRGNVFWLAARWTRFNRWWLNDLNTAAWFDLIRHEGPDLVPDEWPTLADYERWLAGPIDGWGIMVEPIATYRGNGYGAGFCPFVPGKMGTLTGYRARVAHAQSTLMRLRPWVTNWDWQEIAGACGPGDFVYIDPPYRGSVVNAYRPVNHAALASTLAAADYRWALSEADEEFYTPVLGRPVARMPKRCQIDHNAAGANIRMECLWIGGPIV